MLPMIIGVIFIRLWQTICCTRTFMRMGENNGQLNIGYASWHNLNGTSLQATGLQNFQVYNWQQCAIHCIKTQDCFSFNLEGIRSNDVRNCQLSSQNPYTSNELLENVPESTLFTFLTPCSTKPCVHRNETCTPNYVNGTYICDQGCVDSNYNIHRILHQVKTFLHILINTSNKCFNNFTRWIFKEEWEIIRGTWITNQLKVYADYMISLQFQIVNANEKDQNVILTLYSNPDTILHLWYDKEHLKFYSHVSGLTAVKIHLKSWYSVIVTQEKVDGQYVYSIYVNNNLLKQEYLKEEPKTYYDVAVPASLPERPKFNGTIRNLSVSRLKPKQ